MTSTPRPPQPAAAPSPLASAAAHWSGALCAVLLVAVGVVGIRDGVAAAGWIQGNLWTRAAIAWVDGQSAHGWMVPVGAILALLGLALVIAGVKPRRRKAVPVQARTSVYLDIGDAAKLATAAAQAVPGVTRASARATRRAMTVRARTTGPDVTDDSVAAAVRDALTPLAAVPRIAVRTHVEGI